MKSKLRVYTVAGMLAIAGLAFGYTSSNNSSCPLEGKPNCPILDCPLAGTPECPFEVQIADIPTCCVKK